MSIRQKTFIFVCAGILAIGGGFFLYAHKDTALANGRLTVAHIGDDSAKNQAGAPNVDKALHGKSLAKHAVVVPSGLSKGNARKVFVDESKSLESRYGTLMDMANSGDRNALHLAFQIQRNCAMWEKLSPSQFIPETWKPAMGVALTSLQGKCAGVLEVPQSQAWADREKGQANDVYDQDVRTQILQAFADGGPDQALSQALASYENRPDPTTAELIANTLANLDVTNFGQNLAITGSQAMNPNYRRDIFTTALDLLACDYGVPCGPGSIVVSSFCINSGVCYPGYNLSQIYENVLLSGEDLQNVNAILTYLRTLTAQTRQ